MSRCCGTELKKPTRSSLVACSEMSGGVWCESGAKAGEWTFGLDAEGRGVGG